MESMKQIAKRNLTLIDKLEIIKNGKFEVKSIKHGNSYTIKTIFKDKDNKEKFISLQINKKYLKFLLPLLEVRVFVPEKVFPDVLMIAGCVNKGLFFYVKKDKPHFIDKYRLYEYHQNLLKRPTTLNMFGYRLLIAVKLFMETEEKIEKHMKRPLK